MEHSKANKEKAEASKLAAKAAKESGSVDCPNLPRLGHDMIKATMC
jgi:hypothetical protein